jgi:hypothetical protein
MYDRHATNGSHGGLPPPPYEQSQREELAASSVYEVPEPLLTTAELDGHALMPELQDSALNANDYTNTWEGYLTSSVYSDATKHWVADVGYTLPRPLIPIETPKLPWSLNTEHQFAPRPGVVSGGQSHEYSPTYVSPVTPRQDDSSASQPYPPYSFSDGTISPQSLMSPPDNNWAGPPPFHATHSYNTQSSFASSLESSPTEPSSAYSQSDSADQLMLPHVPVSSNVSPSSSRVAAYNMNNRHPFAPQPSVVGPQPHCHHTAKTVPGIYEYHESLGWHRHPNQEPTPSDANRDDHLRIVRGQPESPHYVDHSKERQQGTLIHGEDSFHHAPPARHPPLDEETVPPPAKPCGECNKVFHGRYVDIPIIFTQLQTVADNVQLDIALAICEGTSWPSTTQWLRPSKLHVANVSGYTNAWMQSESMNGRSIVYRMQGQRSGLTDSAGRYACDRL